MPYIVVEVPGDQADNMRKLFAQEVRVTDVFEASPVFGQVIEMGSEYRPIMEEE